MRIRFISEHLSIRHFNDVETNHLVVMTGLNGAGKSHLLSAIEAGSVSIDPFETPRIVRFNFENFRLDNEAAFSTHQIRTEKEAAWSLFQNSLRQNFVNVGAYLENYKETNTVFGDASSIIWERRGFPNIDLYISQVENLFRQPHNADDPTHKAILNVARQASKPLDLFSKEEFIETINIEKKHRDFLPGALGKIIWEYYEKFLENEFNDFENKKYGSSKPVMSESEFISVNGEKPWLVLNRILSKFSSLDYRINSPEGLSHSAPINSSWSRPVTPVSESISSISLQVREFLWP